MQKHVKICKIQKLTSILSVQLTKVNNIRMKTRTDIGNSTRNIFARYRTNNCGESQMFDSSDAALSWVQNSTREILQSGYSRANFTIRDQHDNILYQGHTTSTQYSFTFYNGEEKQLKIKYKHNKKRIMSEKKMKKEANFFDVAENEVINIATATMNAATASKGLGNDEFAAAISNASNGLVTLQRSANNPDRVDFRVWEPFTLTHEKKDPGKKSIDAIKSTILDTYKRYNSEAANTNDVKVVSDNTVIKSVKDFAEDVVSIILVHLHKEKYMKRYLSSHSQGLESEISTLTKGLLNCSVTDDTIELTCSTGKTIQILVRNKPLNEVEHELMVAIERLLIHAGLSPKTRNAVVRIIDVDELSDLYYSNTCQPELVSTSACESVYGSTSNEVDTSYVGTNTFMAEYSNLTDHQEVIPDTIYNTIAYREVSHDNESLHPMYVHKKTPKKEYQKTI